MFYYVTDVLARKAFSARRKSSVKISTNVVYFSDPSSSPSPSLKDNNTAPKGLGRFSYRNYQMRDERLL